MYYSRLAEKCNWSRRVCRTLWSLYAKLRRLLQQVHLFLPAKKQSAHSPLFRPCAPDGYFFRQYRIILSADTASEVRQMLSQKRR